MTMTMIVIAGCDWWRWHDNFYECVTDKNDDNDDDDYNNNGNDNQKDNQI